MSTTYGFIFHQKDLDEHLEIRVAFEHGTPHGTEIKFVHPKADKLADDVILIPTDNGGAPKTVGQIREQIRKQELHDKHLLDVDSAS